VTRYLVPIASLLASVALLLWLVLRFCTGSALSGL
jgi:hypothetical protein